MVSSKTCRMAVLVRNSRLQVILGILLLHFGRQLQMVLTDPDQFPVVEASVLVFKVNQLPPHILACFETGSMETHECDQCFELFMPANRFSLRSNASRIAS